jgi:dihydrofolate synthase/folylpolyglutamate synthase
MTDSKPHYTPYERWVRRIYQTNLFNPVKLGLSNIDELHKAMGQPMDQRPVIHVAGTNGKGSVALKIATTLQLLNPSLKVGLFCSPHVSCFRERMQINGQLISEDQVVECLPGIYKLCERKDIPATFFEITTALAFSYFQEADVVVLETGLGGRLDATNVIQAPALSIITSIGLEHTRILGDTIELIAIEKGGIIKKDCPVLVGPHCPHAVLRECAIEKGASQYYTCDDVLGPVQREITDYDEENARIARAALTIFKEKYPQLIGSFQMDIIDKGTSIRPPCRFETVDMDAGLTVILDVAHNPPAMEYLINKLKNTYPDCNIRIVVGMSSDKDLGLVGQMLLNFVDVDNIHLVEAFHPRAAKIEHIIEGEPRLADSHWLDEDRTITTQIKIAMQIAREKDEILVICGSVFLMSEAREALGFDEPRDSEYIAEVAGAHLRHGQEVFANTNPEDAPNGGAA